MLVVDYTGGEPLDHLVRQPMEVGQFLRLAVALAGAIGQLHGRGLIHKDIKPPNCLWTPQLVTSVSPASASHRAFRASAKRPNLLSSSLEHSRTWRPSRLDG